MVPTHHLKQMVLAAIHVVIVVRFGNRPASCHKIIWTNPIFDLAQEFIAKQQAFTPDRPKYFQRSFTNLCTIFTFIEQITDLKISKQLYPDFELLVNEQMKQYKHKGVAENTKIKDLISSNTENYGLLYYLVELYAFLAKCNAKFATSQEELREALVLIKKAEKLNGSAIGSYKPEIAGGQVGILQRIGNTEHTFTYVAHLLSKYPLKDHENDLTENLGYQPDQDAIEDYKKDIKGYQEEIKLQFETIIFSEAFQNWKNNKL